MQNTEMSREQRRLVEQMRATATDFAVLARTRYAFVGGMQWLTVKGKEYLARYRRDPLSGEQQSTSLGRRSPETEALYNRFVDGRAERELSLAEIKPVMAEQARMAKALRLSRTPSEIADVARAIGFSDLADHVSIVGEAAVYGYECELSALLPREMLPDDGLDLLVAGVEPEDAVDEIADALRRERIAVRRAHGVDGAELRTEEGLRIKLITPSMLNNAVARYAESHPDEAEAARWALEQPPIHSIFIDRQGRAAPVLIFEPRAYCILRYMSLDLNEMSVGSRKIALELNSSLARAIQEHWPESFEDSHVAAFESLAEALEEQGEQSPRF
jgi:hypothetical protein